MHIICPHCTTSYAIDLATLGAAGRTVRCSRCKEVWQARPEDAIEIAASAPAMAAAGNAEQEAAAEWEAMAREDDGQETPVVDSPSISGDCVAPAAGDGATAAEWGLAAQEGQDAVAAGPQRLSRLRNLFQPPALLSGKPFVALPTLC